MRYVVSLAIGTALLVGTGVASAKEPSQNPAVVCAPSVEQTHNAPMDSILPLCLLRLSPLFERTSFEVTPKAAKKRWVAEFEFRF